MTHSAHRTACGLLLGVLLVASLPAPLRAQSESGGGINFGIGGGISLPVGSAKDAFQNGIIGQALVRYDFGGAPLAIRAEFSYESFDLRPPALAGTGATSGSGTLLGGLGGLQVYLGRDHVRPYLFAGAGAYTVKIEPDLAGAPSRDDSRFGVNGGAGFMFSFGSLMLYAETRLEHVFVNDVPAGSDAVRILPVSVGVLF